MTLPSIAVLKATYPSPCAVHTREQGPHAYCIGGAALAALSGLDLARLPEDQRFPGRAELAAALRTTTPRLDAENAQFFAQMIIVTNDAADFDTAWRWLDDALRFPYG